MKVVYIANTCEHVVRPLCDGLYSEYGENFIFIETTELDKNRAGIGCLETRPYIFNAIGKEDEAKKLCDEADVVIFGGVSLDYIQKRISENKLTIYYSERMFKKGFYRYFNPITMTKVRKRFVNPSRNSNFHLLCASSYAALDFNRVGAFRNKMYKWGYQIEIREQDIDALMAGKPEDGLKFVWVGRLVALKHCDDAIRVVARLKNEGYAPRLTIIGSGEEEQKLKALVAKLGAEEFIHFKGTCKIDETRAEMDKANIFMFTSDFGEGWGATLNECMNSACACVANHAAGSTNFLIEDKVDGLIYKNGDVEALYQKVKFLVDNKAERERIARKAYDKMSNEWNPAKSYKRMVALIDLLLKTGNCELYKEGPCSKAYPIKENWYKD
ncbi:MAG: glycosyltransferase family 4 protein [Ruminococcaceae bacterium]|nr:glycosyltransferase family 4 protein [Oscillospiraceae bacterium]MBE6707194.1 glycosyltransferase family 4 protein [Oscillospiraceae bacterium]